MYLLISMIIASVIVVIIHSYESDAYNYMKSLY